MTLTSCDAVDYEAHLKPSEKNILHSLFSALFQGVRRIEIGAHTGTSVLLTQVQGLGAEMHMAGDVSRQSKIRMLQCEWCNGLISTSVLLGFDNQSVAEESCGDLPPCEATYPYPLTTWGEVTNSVPT